MPASIKPQPMGAMKRRQFPGAPGPAAPPPLSTQAPMSVAQPLNSAPAGGPQPASNAPSIVPQPGVDTAPVGRPASSAPGAPSEAFLRGLGGQPGAGGVSSEFPGRGSAPNATPPGASSVVPPSQGSSFDPFTGQWSRTAGGQGAPPFSPGGQSAPPFMPVPGGPYGQPGGSPPFGGGMPGGNVPSPPVPAPPQPQGNLGMGGFDPLALFGRR